MLVARIESFGKNSAGKPCFSECASLRVDVLDLTFQTAELREICEKRDVAVAELGYAAARELADRLADIEAVDTVAEFAKMLGEVVCDKTPTEKCFRLASGFNVVFVSAHPLRVQANLESTDWTKTIRIRITAIEAANG